MTENVSTGNLVEPGDSYAQQVVQQAPNGGEAHHEPTLPQSKVNELVGRAKHEAREKGRQEALAEMQKGSQPAASTSLGGMPSLSEEQIRNMMAQEAAKHYQNVATNAEVQRIANEFNTKLQTGKSAYPDFDEKMGKINLGSIPHIVYMANQHDNTADIMYDLINNPHKIASLTTNYQLDPNLASLGMSQLSQSIKQNKDALGQRMPDEPLSHIKPSPVGRDDGPKTVKDFKRLHRV